MTITVQDEPTDLAMIEDRAESVAHLYVARVNATPDSEAYRYPEGDGWASITWAEVDARVRPMAAGLIALGIKAEERVGVASSTRLEWVLADLAVMVSGAATTTIYPTTTEADVAYIVGDSQSGVVFAEDETQVAKIRSHRDSLPDLSAVVVFDGEGDGDWVISLAELERRGALLLAKEPTVLEDRIAAITSDQLATLVYTSGTTGRPKGVRLAHGAWTYEAAAVDAIGILTKDDLQYLWLPLSHVFGKVLLTLPLQIGLPTAVDGRVDKIVENLAVIKPTFMGAAPRVFEKAYGKVATTMAQDGGIKAKLFDWAFGIGAQVAALRAQGKKPSGVLAVQHRVADTLVLSKVRDRFGGRIRFFVSGSAALNRDIAEWFDAAGLLILEGYGLTETSAASFINRPVPGGYALGSVGWPLPGTEAKVADDGEILLRGLGVMQSYHHLPEASAEALDDEGWLHTGDIGNIDDQGFLRITDRKKDLFKTSNGKYVAPSAIESLFKGICPYASQLVIEGDGRSFVSALITLDPDSIEPWAQGHELGGRSYAEIVTSPAAREMVQEYVDELNSQLNRWETIKKFIILPRDLSIEEGELTPSMKLKRTVVTRKYHAELDGIYAN